MLMRKNKSSCLVKNTKSWNAKRRSIRNSNHPNFVDVDDPEEVLSPLDLDELNGVCKNADATD